MSINFRVLNVKLHRIAFTHYNVELSLVGETDYNTCGILAVIFYLTQDNAVNAIVFVSRTFTNTEEKYNHVDNEGLCISFRVKKNFRCSSAKSVILFTDNKSLLSIF